MRDTLRLKLLAPLVFALLALIVAAAIIAGREMQTASKFELLTPLGTLAKNAGDLVHELQKERGLTVRLISGGYEARVREELENQRASTDSELKSYRQFADAHPELLKHPELRDTIKRINTAFDKLRAHRSAVNGEEMSVEGNVEYYTSMIQDLLTLTDKMARLAPRGELKDTLVPLSHLMRAKENAGLERAFGSALFNEAAQGTVSLATYRKYHSHLVRERSFLEQFRQSATPEQKQLFDRIVRGSAVNKVERWRDHLQKIVETDDAQGVDGQVWFDTATKRINMYKTVTDKLSQTAQTKAASVLQAEYMRMWATIAVAAVIVLSVIAFGVLTTGRMTRVMGALREVIGRVADGETNLEVPHAERRDFLGGIAKSVIIFRDGAIENKRLTEEQEAEARAKAERAEKVQQITAQFESAVGEIIEGITASAQQLNSTSESMSRAAGTTSERAQAVSSSAEQASSNVQTVSSAAQEMTTSIDEVGNRINQTSETARAARERTDNARGQVQSLSQAADEIGGAIQQIQDIAEKTNLLALNATIEAARAGEAGKGFAVVADEVKSLASQTQKTVEDISQRIQKVQSETSEAVGVIETVATNMQEIDDAASSIASAVEEQISSMREISRNVEEASAGVQDVASQITDVKDASQETTTASNEVLTAASTLSQNADALSEKVDTFLKEVRAG